MMEFTQEEIEFLQDLNDVAFESGFRCEVTGNIISQPSQKDLDISEAINKKLKQLYDYRQLFQVLRDAKIAIELGKLGRFKDSQIVNNAVEKWFENAS